MRIIEPKPHNRRHQKSSRAGKNISIGVCILMIAFVSVTVLRHVHHKNNASKVLRPQTTSNGSSRELISKTPTPKPKTTLKIFTGAQFKALYDTFAYPNTNEILDPPTITGNAEADQHIRDMALKKGYRLRSTPKGPMPTYEDFTFQQKAVDDYKRLELAAQNAAIPIAIEAAFRSPEDQRELFVARMNDTGITSVQIADGSVDRTIDQLLAMTSVPGYSRHHTGYTLDLGCTGYEVFKFSPCYTWLTQNNFEIAKTYGWIPSYPDGATGQGPEPEPWEFVWVGVDVLYE